MNWHLSRHLLRLLIVGGVLVALLPLFVRPLGETLVPRLDGQTCGSKALVAFVDYCADPGPMFALIVFLAAALLVLTRKGALWLATSAGLMVLALAVNFPAADHPPVGVPATTRCGIAATWISERYICIGPSDLSQIALALVALVVVIVAAERTGRKSLPEVMVASFLAVGLVGGIWLRDVRSPPRLADRNQRQLRVMTKDLATGAVLVRPGQYVSLILAGEGASEARVFPNLQVLGLYAEDGHNVTYTGELVNNVLLSVPSEELDPILAAFRDKKTTYLRGQSGVEATPGLTPTSRPVLVTIPIANSAIQPYDGEVLADGGHVVLMVVEEHRASDGKTLLDETHRYEGTVTRCEGVYTYVSIDRGSRDTAAQNLTAQLTGAHQIYFLAPAPTPNTAGTPVAPTATPTPVPSGAPTPAPTPTPTSTPPPVLTPCARPTVGG